MISITLRALETLKEADVIFCEDTRHTIKLLNAYEIKKPLYACHKFNEKEAAEKILAASKRGEKVELSLTITNEGEMLGDEIVQLYFKDKVCKMLTPVRTLLDFKKVSLKAGETAKVSFVVDTEKLGYYDRNCQYQVEAGEFALYVSGDGKTFKEIVLAIVE